MTMRDHIVHGVLVATSRVLRVFGCDMRVTYEEEKKYAWLVEVAFIPEAQRVSAFDVAAFAAVQQWKAEGCPPGALHAWLVRAVGATLPCAPRAETIYQELPPELWEMGLNIVKHVMASGVASIWPERKTAPGA
jgi:hypothetical protein